MQPTTYYAESTGIGLAVREAQSQPAIKVGVVGLGAGTLASYGRAGDTFRFYEINPLVLEVARQQFHFLPETPAKTEVVLGDARLSMEREPAQGYDVLAVDAFSGDAIPVHLLTREAFAQYFRHLKPSGVLAIHASNRYLDLTSIVELEASAAGKRAWVISSDEDDDTDAFEATWVLISDRAAFFDAPPIRVAGEAASHRTDLRPWSDDYSNLLQILR
jgi:spermidine synthase